jgi:hypothetical protein
MLLELSAIALDQATLDVARNLLEETSPLPAARVRFPPGERTKGVTPPVEIVCGPVADEKERVEVAPERVRFAPTVRGEKNVDPPPEMRRASKSVVVPVRVK